MTNRRILVASCDFVGALTADRAAAAIARGLCAGDLLDPDECAIRGAHPQTTAAGSVAGGLSIGPPNAQSLMDGFSPRTLIDALDFDTRMRTARAVIVADESLDPLTLNGSVVFEIATRARQGGVPAYAITGRNALSAFDARVLDLQVIIEAHDQRSLETAGMQLAALV